LATKEEQALHDALINTYTYNLKFLNEYDNGLFQRVNFLSDAIAQNLYKERYFLEFIKDNGEFDIFDNHTNNYLYERKPKQWNNKAITKSNFDLDNTINLLTTSIYEKNITDLSETKENLFEKENLKISSDIKNYQNIRYEKLNNKTRKVKEFNKMLFVGTLLARHIPKIVQKLNTKNHFICEANLEIFRLSLFVCDYSMMARDGKTVVFSIMDDEHIFLEKFNIFFTNEITSNVVYKYYSTNYNIENYFDRIINLVLNKDPMLFNYRLILDSIVTPTVTNFNLYKTLHFGKVTKTANVFQDKDILFIGAGPSLGKNIQWLKENQNKFIIVTMAAALKKLAQFDIKPDIITSLDPQESIVFNQFNGGNQTHIKEAIKILSLNTPQKVFDIFKENNELVYTYELLKSFQMNNIAIDGLSIGEVTFKILLLLKPKNIYLLGIDLAFDQKTGHTHIDTHGSHDKNKFVIDKNKKDNESMLKQSFSVREDSIMTKGNFLDKVATSRLFYLSLSDYNSAVKLFKDTNTFIYNLSENGAFIEQTIPTCIADVKLEESDFDKNSLRDDLLKNFNMVSTKTLEDFDKHAIFFQIEQIDGVLEQIKEFKELKIKTYEQFKSATFNITQSIFALNSEATYLTEIYINFSFIINRYIDFVFNSREIKNETNDIKEIQHIWALHLSSIIETYKKGISKLSD